MQQAFMAHGVTEHSDVRSLDWFQFEKLVGILFQEEGFAVRRFGGANPDDGIDLTATKNGITFGVQCKQWKTWRVGVKEVRAFLGALHDQHLRHGFLITLEGFTKEAADFARRNQIDLLDEPLLLQNLEEVGWTHNSAFAAVLDDPRKICPKCEAEMVLRTAKKGNRIGSHSGAANATRTAPSACRWAELISGKRERPDDRSGPFTHTALRTSAATT